MSKPQRWNRKCTMHFTNLFFDLASCFGSSPMSTFRVSSAVTASTTKLILEPILTLYTCQHNVTELCQAWAWLLAELEMIFNKLTFTPWCKVRARTWRLLASIHTFHRTSRWYAHELLNFYACPISVIMQKYIQRLVAGIQISMGQVQWHTKLIIHCWLVVYGSTQSR